MKRYLILGALFCAPTAFAGSSAREGFNFGALARMVSNQDSQALQAGTSTQSMSTTAVSPFVGFTLGKYINLGVSLTSENTSVTNKLTQAGRTDTTTEVHDLKGASVFGRLLFAKYMFLEAGAGVYQGTVKVANATLVGEGSYSGSNSQETHSGTGYGLHGGGGVEIPVGLGWFVVTSMQARQVQMTEILNQKASNQLSNVKTELQFGLIQYLQ